jgi:hypothetical protein
MGDIMGRTAAAAFLAAFLVSSAASAATVETVEGQVSLNRGDGYRPIAVVAAAKSGDLVMASPGGSGKIVYADGCAVEVKPGTVIAVQSQSPCKTAHPHRVRNYLLGGAAVAGITVGIIALTKNNNNEGGGAKPASP